MATNPRLVVNLSKIRNNAYAISSLAGTYGIEVMGVTKGVSAAPEVARAMLEGGVARLGDSRLKNLQKMRKAGIDAHLTLLRSPMLSEAPDVVGTADRVLVSDTPVLEALSRVALQEKKQVEVVLMVDLGDLREGFWPEQEAWLKGGSFRRAETIEEAIEFATRLGGIEIVGIGVNLACFGAIIPTVDKMLDLLRVARRVESVLGRPLSVISGGNSANLALLIENKMPEGITELRIGEGILLGTEAVAKRPVPGCVQDAFTLVGEVIEVRKKPSVPIGEVGIDAFGGVPTFSDRGIRTRAIIAAGRQDVDWQDMRPREPGVFILGSSSDHLVLDVEDRGVETRVGDEIEFDVGYSCMLRASTSEYVSKLFVHANPVDVAGRTPVPGR